MRPAPVCVQRCKTRWRTGCDSRRHRRTPREQEGGARTQGRFEGLPTPVTKRTTPRLRDTARRARRKRWRRGVRQHAVQARSRNNATKGPRHSQQNAHHASMKQPCARCKTLRSTRGMRQPLTRISTVTLGVCAGCSRSEKGYWPTQRPGCVKRTDPNTSV